MRVEADVRVGPVAERLVGGLPAPAERHPVTALVLGAVGRDDARAAANPDRAARALLWVLDQDNRQLEGRLDRLIVVSNDG